jgi:MFS family permease
MRRAPPPRRALIALCVTEITSWGVLFYAFPVLLSDLTADTGWSVSAGMGAFSVGAIVSAIAGVPVGRLIDRHGPRPVMTTGSLIGVAAVLSISAAPNLACFYAAWMLSGVAQAALLYPPAFAALTRWYGPDRVRALTVLTLVAGLSSTVFAPLTAVLLDHMSWRGVYLVLAALLAGITIPLHFFYLTPSWPTTQHTDRPTAGDPTSKHTRDVLRSRAFILLATALAVAAFGMFAATVNLVQLFDARGFSNQLGALALGLCGAGQVLGRLGYARLAHHTTPRARTAGILTTGAATVVLLGLLPGPAIALITIAILAGAARGIFTLLLATAVADRWGTTAFGHINGVLNAPVTALTALAPGGGSLLADLTNSYPASYSLLALLTLAAAATALATRPARAGPESGCA